MTDVMRSLTDEERQPIEEQLARLQRENDRYDATIELIDLQLKKLFWQKYLLDKEQNEDKKKDLQRALEGNKKLMKALREQLDNGVLVKKRK